MTSAKSARPRVRSLPKYKTLRLSKKRYKQPAAIPGTRGILKATVKTLLSNKKLFFSIALVNLLLTFIFVHGLGYSWDLAEVKSSFEELLGENGGQLTTAVALLGYLAGTASSAGGEGAGTYQFFIILITSLATIWAVRQVLAGEKPGLRDSFYKGMYPLVPFVLVLFVFALQLLPLLIGNLVYSSVINNGLAATGLENIVFLLLFAGLALLSGYMITSSIFALYITTLPEMTPIKALRSARELVVHRRLGVALRILALPFVLILLSAAVLLPLLIYAAPLAQILFILLTSFSLIVTHVYMYLLYRELI